MTMKNKNHKIDVEKIIAEVSTNLKDLKNDIQTGNYSDEDWEEIKTGLEVAEFKAYVVKVNIHLDQLVKTSPHMPIRDVIIHLLPHMRTDASANMIAKVIRYVSEEWEERRLKVAA